MEETPDIPPAEEVGPAVSRPFGGADKVLAGVMLVGVLLLGYVCVDVLAGGRITRALSAPLPEAET